MPVLPPIPPPHVKGVTVVLPDTDQTHAGVYKFVAEYSLSAKKAANLLNFILALRPFIQTCQGSEQNARWFLEERKIATKLVNTSKHFLDAMKDWGEFHPDAKETLEIISTQLERARMLLGVEYPSGRSRGMRDNIDIGMEVLSFMLADAYKMTFNKQPTASVDTICNVGKASHFETFFRGALAALGIEAVSAQRTLSRHLANWRKQRRAGVRTGYAAEVVKK